MAFDFAAPAARLLQRVAIPAAFTLALGAAPVLAQSDAPVSAEPPVSPQTVVATLNGQEITERDLAFAAEDLAAELQSIPADQHRAFLLTVVVDMKVMADAARAEGLAEGEDFTRRVAYLEDRALRQAYFSEVIEAAVTEDTISAFYEDIVADYVAEPEIRARHIVVETLDEATAIRAEIEEGLAFEDAAAEYGTDGTSTTGGDLGYFSSGMMVQPFEDAAFALEVGELSQPVESQFGWHLILLEDRRLSEAPTLASVRQQIAQQVLYESFETHVGGLKADTEVTITDAELAAQVEALGGI